jgi:hypothetical protein
LSTRVYISCPLDPGKVKSGTASPALNKDIFLSTPLLIYDHNKGFSGITQIGDTRFTKHGIIRRIVSREVFS